MDPFKVKFRQCRKCYEFRPEFEFKISGEYRRNECDDCFKIRRARECKEYREGNPKRWSQYMRRVRKENPSVRIADALRSRIWLELRKLGIKKENRTLEFCGCTKAELIQHLEGQFRDGMSWDNYGKYGWHVDHIRPCSSFDLTDPEQQKQCFHYTNLQPLWAAENLSKGDDWDGE